MILAVVLILCQFRPQLVVQPILDTVDRMRFHVCGQVLRELLHHVAHHTANCRFRELSTVGWAWNTFQNCVLGRPQRSLIAWQYPLALLELSVQDHCPALALAEFALHDQCPDS